MSILVITYGDDNITVREVIGRLRDEGQHVFRLDSDRMPQDVRLRHSFGAEGASMTITSEDDEVCLRDVTAVWYRRNRIGRALPLDMERGVRETVIREASTALFGALDALPAFFVDRYSTVRRASQKPLQLSIARQLGLTIPPTLISNDAAAVRAFAAEHGDLVFKPVSDIAIGDEYPVRRVWTNRLSAEELDSLEGLNLSPMIFQQEIPKQIEIRATIIGREIFCAAVDPAAVGADDDWRKQGEALLERWFEYELPEPIRDRLLAMMDRLRLHYGAADLILTPTGELVFLEINPCGELCWLDQNTGLPLGEAMTSLLMSAA